MTIKSALEMVCLLLTPKVAQVTTNARMEYGSKTNHVPKELSLIILVNNAFGPSPSR